MIGLKRVQPEEAGCKAGSLFPRSPEHLNTVWNYHRDLCTNLELAFHDSVNLINPQSALSDLSDQTQAARTHQSASLIHQADITLGSHDVASIQYTLM